MMTTHIKKKVVLHVGKARLKSVQDDLYTSQLYFSTDIFTIDKNSEPSPIKTFEGTHLYVVQSMFMIDSRVNGSNYFGTP